MAAQEQKGNPVMLMPGRWGRPPARSTWKYADGNVVSPGDAAAKARLFDKMLENLSEGELMLLESAIAGRRAYSLVRLARALPEVGPEKIRVGASTDP